MIRRAKDVRSHRLLLASHLPTLSSTIHHRLSIPRSSLSLSLYVCMYVCKIFTYVYMYVYHIDTVKVYMYVYHIDTEKVYMYIYQIDTEKVTVFVGDFEIFF